MRREEREVRDREIALAYVRQGFPPKPYFAFSQGVTIGVVNNALIKHEEWAVLEVKKR